MLGINSLTGVLFNLKIKLCSILPRNGHQTVQAKQMGYVNEVYYLMPDFLKINVSDAFPPFLS
jgi:hypothetical protein